MGIAYIPEQQDGKKSDLGERSFHVGGEGELLGQSLYHTNSNHYPQLEVLTRSRMKKRMDKETR